MEGATVTVDMREAKLAQLLPEARVARLDVGDVHVEARAGRHAPRLVIAELKTVDDLVASVKDGRYKEQRARLLASLRAAGGPADCALYVVQGAIRPGASAVDPLHVITSLVCRHRLPVYRTRDAEETAGFVRALAHRVAAMANQPDVDAASADDYRRRGCLVSPVKKSNLGHPRALWIAQLQCVPGVSANVAAAVADAVVASPAALVERARADRAAAVRAIADVDVPSLAGKRSRRVGEAVARRVVAAALGEPSDEEPADKRRRATEPVC